MPTPEQFEQEAIKRLKEHTGYKPSLCRDPLNYNIATGGYGHNFGEPISPKLAELILGYDWEKAKAALRSVFVPEALSRLPYHKYYVLVELMFQLGLQRFKDFRQMIAAIEKADLKAAAKELRDSLYYAQAKMKVEPLAKELES